MHQDITLALQNRLLAGLVPGLIPRIKEVHVARVGIRTGKTTDGVELRTMTIEGLQRATMRQIDKRAQELVRAMPPPAPTQTTPRNTHSVAVF